jgi:hypothetical protein
VHVHSNISIIKSNLYSFYRCIENLKTVIHKTNIGVLPINNSLKRDENSVVHRSVTKFVSSRWDNHEINVYKNEKTWLLKLSGSNHFPKLIFYDDISRVLTTQYCGENINVDNFPVDLFQQLQEILHELRKHNCRHNDIKPNELLIYNGIIHLVDFGWASDINENIPQSWPHALGGKFKCNPRSDIGSLYMSLDSILCSIHRDILERSKKRQVVINNILSTKENEIKHKPPDDIRLEDEVGWWKDTIRKLS